MYRMFDLSLYEFEKLRILMAKLGPRTDFSYEVFVNYFKNYIPFEGSDRIYSLQDYMYEHDGKIPEGKNRVYGLEDKLSEFNVRGIWNFFESRNGGTLDFFDFLNHELNTSLLIEFRNYYDISFNRKYYRIHRASAKKVPKYVKKKLRRYIGVAANSIEFYYYGRANENEYLIQHPIYKNIYIAYDRCILANGVVFINVL